MTRRYIFDPDVKIDVHAALTSYNNDNTCIKIKKTLILNKITEGKLYIYSRLRKWSRHSHWWSVLWYNRRPFWLGAAFQTRRSVVYTTRPVQVHTSLTFAVNPWPSRAIGADHRRAIDHRASIDFWSGFPAAEDKFSSIYALAKRT